jgi:hypothetical protein
VRPSRLWSLLLLPGGLATGHVLRHAVAQLLGATPPIEAGSSLMESLVCLAVPLFLVVLGRAILAGTRMEQAPIRVRLLAPLQVLCFAVIEVAEHVTAGSRPSLSNDMFLVLGLLAQIGAAWLVCAAINAATRAVTRAVAARRAHCRPAVRQELPPTAQSSPFGVAMSSLSRRGPPAFAPG